MRDATSSGPVPSRRSVTVGALGIAVTASLSACGIRLEDDAPRVPLVPTRTPLAGEAAMITLLAAVRRAAVTPTLPATALSAQLITLHERQATVLHDALRQRGVPQDALADTQPSATPTATAAPSMTPTPSASETAPTATVPAVEGAVIAGGAGCEAAEPELRPMLVALLAQPRAAIDVASGRPGPPPAQPPTWTRPAGLAPLITALRAATYFLEVAAARSAEEAREAGREGVARLESLTSEIVAAAGATAPSPALGHVLPGPVTTPAEVAALATSAVTDLLGEFGAALASLTSTDPEAAFAALPRWLGIVAAEAHRKGVTLTPFPGLT